MSSILQTTVLSSLHGVISACVPALFLFTSSNKLTNFSRFVSTIEKTPYLPRKSHKILGFMLLTMEVLVPIAYISPYPGISYSLCGALLFLYSIYFVLMGAKQLHIDCNCFGIIHVGGSSKTSSWIRVARNLALAGIPTLAWLSGNVSSFTPWSKALNLLIAGNLCLALVTGINLRSTTLEFHKWNF